jgi:N-acetylmuramoyl-L-alanine amidase
MKRTDVKYLIVHCAYTPPSMNIGVKEIDQWHREKGWLGCGYHVVIKRNGKVERGRPYHKQGAHVRSINNKSVGICLIGGMTADKKGPEINYTDAQYTALREVLEEQQELFGEDTEVKGHTDFDSGKTCPNFDAALWFETGELKQTF